MKLKTCKAGSHSKLKVTQPASLDFLSGAVANLWIFAGEGGGY